MITGWLNVKLGIMDLLASILMMTALYSINLRIMGGPNIPLITSDTVFSLTQPSSLDDFVWRPVLLFIVVVIVKILLDAYFSTDRSGHALDRLKFTNGTVPGISTDRMVLIGMALSNALVGLGGALFAQSQGGSDISMGIGTIVIGLAAVIVGESILPARRFLFITLAVIVGAILYRFFIALALNSDFIGLKAQDLNLITALLVAIALILPKLRRNLRIKGRA
ncbi:ABC transporter permease [Advenella kashmirensis]|uniref:ABC transporter permease n=1 Tax=Advenella kashmirensis TaxID=310575 RepID=UPI0026AA3C92